MKLYCGRWQDVLSDVSECDAVITDPPYSPKSHSGFRSADDYQAHYRQNLNGRRTQWGKDGQKRHGGASYGGIPYSPIDRHQAMELAGMYLPLWWVIFGDHISFGIWEHALRTYDWYTFAPVVWWRTGGTPRFQGDGPASAVEQILIARVKTQTKCGSLPGIYVHPQVKGNAAEKVLKGQKPVPLMQEIIRDYSRPGDLIVDPYAGSGTTLLAAAIEGRREIGAEMDPNTFELAVKRLSKGYTPRLQLPDRPKPKQGDLL